jgi:hypothetical protein
MQLLITIVSWIVGLLLGGLVVVILYGILTRQINTRNLLYGRMRDGTAYLSPERVQLMIFTLWVGLIYLLDVFETRFLNPTPETAHTLPDVNTQTLALLGGSQTVYLVGKALSMLVARRKKGTET